jgi:hypothetical protein
VSYWCDHPAGARHKRMPKYVQVGKTVYVVEDPVRVLGIRGPLVEVEADHGKEVFHYSYLRRRPLRICSACSADSGAAK